MDKSDFVTLFVAVCSLAAAIASQRQSAKAAKGNNDTSLITSRTEAETEAYMRARAMDTETITRQAGELKEMRAEMAELDRKYDLLEKKYEKLESKHDDLVTQNRRLRERIVELEKH